MLQKSSKLRLYGNFGKQIGKHDPKNCVNGKIIAV